MALACRLPGVLRARIRVAARAAPVARAAEPYLRSGGGTAFILCGSGNNGGDGIGAAVALRQAGFPVRVFLTGNREHMTPDALEMEQRLNALASAVEDFDPAAEKLADKLKAPGCPKVAVTDLAREDMHEAVEDAFRYGKLVLASTTYDGGVFPIMKDFIDRLVEHNYQNKLIGIVENGSWAPMAAKTMKAMFEGCKNIDFTETTVTIKSALSEANDAQFDALVSELL